MHRLIGRKINVVKSNFPSCCRDPRSKWRASLTSLGTPRCSSPPAGILTTSLTPRGSSVPRPKVMTSNSGHTLRLTNKQLTDRQGLVSRWLRRPSPGGVHQVLRHNQQEVNCLDSSSSLFHILPRYAWLGIVSFGVGCAEEGYPGAYTRTQCFLGFVAEQFGLKVNKA